MAALLGVGERRVRDFLYRDERLPARHAETLARVCRERAAAFAALAEELERHAASRRELAARRNFPKRKRGG